MPNEFLFFEPNEFLMLMILLIHVAVLLGIILLILLFLVACYVILWNHVNHISSQVVII
jgi:hypothetical protein